MVAIVTYRLWGFRSRVEVWCHGVRGRYVIVSFVFFFFQPEAAKGVGVRFVGPDLYFTEEYYPV